MEKGPSCRSPSPRNTYLTTTLGEEMSQKAGGERGLGDKQQQQPEATSGQSGELGFMVH